MAGTESGSKQITIYRNDTILGGKIEESEMGADGRKIVWQMVPEAHSPWRKASSSLWETLHQNITYNGLGSPHTSSLHLPSPKVVDS